MKKHKDYVPPSIQKGLDNAWLECNQYREKETLRLALKRCAEHLTQGAFVEVCKVVVKVLPESSWQQTLLILEFARYIKRTNIHMMFTDEFVAVEKYIDGGLAHHYTKTKTPTNDLKDVWERFADAYGLIVPPDAMNECIAAGVENLPSKSSEVALIIVSELGKRIYGHATKSCLGNVLHNLIMNRLKEAFDGPCVTREGLDASFEGFSSDIVRLKLPKHMNATREVRVTSDEVELDLPVRSPETHYYMEQDKMIKEYGIHCGLEEMIVVGAVRGPRKRALGIAIDPSVLQPYIAVRKSLNRTILSQKDDATPETILLAVKEELPALEPDDSAVALDYGVLKAYLLGDQGLIELKKRIMGAMPTPEKTVKCETIYTMTSGMLKDPNVKRFSTDAMLTLLDEVNEICFAACQGTAHERKCVFSDGGWFQDLGQRMQFFYHMTEGDQPTVYVGKEASDRALQYLRSIHNDLAECELEHLKYHQILEHLLTEEQIEDRSDLAAIFYEDFLKREAAKGAIVAVDCPKHSDPVAHGRILQEALVLAQPEDAHPGGKRKRAVATKRRTIKATKMAKATR